MSIIDKEILSPGWAIARIGELVLPNGVFIDGDWVESKDQNPKGDVRLIQLADIGDGVYQDRSSRFLTSEKAQKLGCTFLEVGDVLVARMPDPLGRACIFKGDSKKCVTVVDVCIIRTGLGEMNHRWLMCTINSPQFRISVAALQSGSTRKRISRGNLSTLTLPVPPLSEQRRIVAEIEKQFTRLDAAVNALKRIQANMKRYRASVLKAACEGRLVPTEAALAKAEGRDYEPADRLLSHILKERRANWEADQLAKMKAQGKTPKDDKWKEKYKEPSPPRTTNLPLIPNGWIWVSADQICTQITDGEHIQPRYQPTGYPMLTAKNVRSGHVDFRDIDYIAEQDFNNCLKRCAPQENDLLIVSVGATTGRTAIVGDVKPFALVRSVLMLRPISSPRYLLCWFQSPWCQTWISRASGSSAQAHLYISDTKNIPVPFPPLSEQERIVAEVERHLSIIEELETVVEANLRRAERLRQSILKRAFEGKLVPQDPTDEPASNLLERISTERGKKLSKEKVQKNKRRAGKSGQPKLDWQTPEENIASTKAQTNS